ncbi:MAG: hypothetical protein SVR94_15365, partial [Pseudomonadota bacterium]|nr:hypothetical protein [Pseudomonadota bacterium]
VLFLTAPDSHYQHNAALSAQLSELFNNYTADWLLLPAPLDYHRDHVAISLSLLEIWQQCGQRQRVFCYETWTPLPATWVIDISSVFYLKQQAVQCHQLPLKYCDYLTACQGMAHYRSLYLPQSQQAEVLLELDAAHWPALLTSLYSIREYQEHFLLKRSHGAFHER